MEWWNGAKYRKASERVYSKVYTQVVPDTKEETLVPVIEKQVETGTEVFTDAHKSYQVLGEKGFEHAFVDHAIRYVEGRVYTNGMENYWGLLDRMMHGTYVYCLPVHLFRYTDELNYRFNHRDGTDASRFLSAVLQTSGKRLTYKKLIGKAENVSNRLAVLLHIFCGGCIIESWKIHVRNNLRLTKRMRKLFTY